LERKIAAHAEEIAMVRMDLDRQASRLLISYGVTARAARQAVTSLRRDGEKISFLQIQSLFPVPRRDLERATAGVTDVFVAEENLTGQYRAALATLLSGKRVRGINKIGGLISPSEICRAVRRAQA
jgi:2-oxoglutarate ferredoxin oxidoreductase subunit alpha